MATPTEEADIDAFTDRLRAEGHWVLAGGIDVPVTATRKAIDRIRRDNTSSAKC